MLGQRSRQRDVSLIFAALSLTAGCSGASGAGVAARAGAGGVSSDGGAAQSNAGTGGTGNSSGAGESGGAGGHAATGGTWSMGYYASWSPGQYPVSEIEWGGLTELAVAFYMPQTDGSLRLLGGNPDVAAELVDAAHAHGVLAVASIGGADSGTAFRDATSTSLDSFVANLIALLDTPGYDGIDFDWEPLETVDEAVVIDLAQRIRAARSDALLTIPIGYVNPNTPPDLSGYPAIAAAFDQVNIMSYGMAGAWPGWKSWHSSALYQNDSATPLSVDSSVRAYLDAGVPAAKLGFGIGFYGLCYGPPVTGPAQDLGGSTILAGDGDASYANIMTNYFDPNARQWDSLAREAYLSFVSPTGPAGCTYISYDDEQSIAEKAAYLKQQGLGGVIEWEINEGYLSAAPAGQKSPLLAAVRDQVLR